MKVKSAGIWLIVGQEPREAFVYEGDKRTDKPVLDTKTGVPQWKTSGLAFIPELDVFTDARVSVPVNVAEQLVPGAIVHLGGEQLTASLRGGAFSAINVSISGVENAQVKGNFVDVLGVKK